MFENVLFHDNMNSNIDFFNPLENPFDKSRVIYCFASPFVIEPITRDFFWRQKQNGSFLLSSLYIAVIETNNSESNNW